MLGFFIIVIYESVERLEKGTTELSATKENVACLWKKMYPICTKNTCKINRKGVYSAYIRASQYKSRRGNKSIIRKAKKLL